MSRLEREKNQESKRIKEQEQHKHTATVSELKAKLHEEKMKELQAVRENLIKQHEQEMSRMVKLKEAEILRLKSAVNALRDGSSDKVRTALSTEAREEARKVFDSERLKLLQEITELKSAKKQIDEALNNMIQADKIKAGDLRSEHQSHQEAITKFKWESERDIRRLVRLGLFIYSVPLFVQYLDFFIIYSRLIKWCFKDFTSLSRDLPVIIHQRSSMFLNLFLSIWELQVFLSTLHIGAPAVALPVL